MPGFLDLPSELRNKIYRYCFVLDTPISVGHSRHPSWGQCSITRADATSQLLATCREVHDEGASVLYCENDLKVDCLSALKHFSNVIGKSSTACIKTVIVGQKWWNPDNHRHSYSIFRHFSNLQFVRFGPIKRLFCVNQPLPLYLEPGSMVPNKNSALVWRGVGSHLPLLSRDLSKFFGREGIEVHMIFLMERVCTEEIRKDRYRVAPTASASGLNSSLIKTNYDLVYVDSKPATRDDEDY